MQEMEEMQEMQGQSLSGSSPGGGQGNPLQYSCLENPMDGQAWRATVQESQSLTSEATLHVGTHNSYSRGPSEMVSSVVPPAPDDFTKFLCKRSVHSVTSAPGNDEVACHNRLLFKNMKLV